MMMSTGMMMRVLVRMIVIVVVSVIVRMCALLVRGRAGMRVLVCVFVRMLMRVASAPSVAVSVAMVMMTECCHADEVDYQAKAADDEQLGQSFRLSAFEDALKGLDHDLHADEPVRYVSKVGPSNLNSPSPLHQEDTICESAQGLDLAKSIRKPRAWWPFTCDGCEKTDAQSNTVKEHVNAVAEQAEGICDVAIEGLHGHEGEIQASRKMKVSWPACLR